jgi:hypothetical protein
MLAHSFIIVISYYPLDPSVIPRPPEEVIMAFR